MPLDCFSLGDVLLRVGVPDRHSIHQQWANESFINFFLNIDQLYIFVLIYQLICITVLGVTPLSDQRAAKCYFFLLLHNHPSSLLPLLPSFFFLGGGGVVGSGGCL